MAGPLQKFFSSGRSALPTMRIASRAMSTSRPPLRILVVDGYAAASREGFKSAGMDQASTMYSKLLARNAPKNVDIEFEMISPCEEGYEMPSSDYLKKFDGCAFTGSSLSAYGQEPDVIKQVDLYNAVSDAGVSLFGSCWALQVCAVALGGKVELSPKGREVGPGRKIALTEAGKSHPMFSGKKHTFEAFMSHSDEVIRPPDGALVLAGNDHTTVQAMAVTRQGVESWFVQYHPEYDLLYYSQLIYSRRQRMLSMGFFQDDPSFDLYCRELAELHHDPTRKDISWKYGYDVQDMIGRDQKEAEPRNWLRYIMSLRA